MTHKYDKTKTDLVCIICSCEFVSLLYQRKKVTSLFFSVATLGLNSSWLTKPRNMRTYRPSSVSAVVSSEHCSNEPRFVSNGAQSIGEMPCCTFGFCNTPTISISNTSNYCHYLALLALFE